MAPGTAITPFLCEDRTIILPNGQEEYEKIVPHPQSANKFAFLPSVQELVGLSKVFFATAKIHKKRSVEKARETIEEYAIIKT